VSVELWHQEKSGLEVRHYKNAHVDSDVAMADLKFGHFTSRKLTA